MKTLIISLIPLLTMSCMLMQIEEQDTNYTAPTEVVIEMFGDWKQEGDGAMWKAGLSAESTISMTNGKKELQYSTVLSKNFNLKKKVKFEITPYTNGWIAPETVSILKVTAYDDSGAEVGSQSFELGPNENGTLLTGKFKSKNRITKISLQHFGKVQDTMVTIKKLKLIY
jgi:hypothetical protein